MKGRSRNSGVPLGFEVGLCRPVEALSEQFAELRQLEEKSRRT